jgi:hypothetical protein
MKHLPVIVLLAGLAPAFSAEHAELKGPPQPVRLVRAPRSWLGLELAKPDESITAHLPGLPQGIGFVIRVVDTGGPADAAGLKEYDVLWKLGDQLLVNEGQLAALLRLSKPGEEVVLSGFRAGKSIEVKLRLGEAPDTNRAFPGNLVEETLLPGECPGPMRVVNVAEKLASYKTDDGRLEVRKDGMAYKVKIQGPMNETIFDGETSADGGMGQVPEAWKRRVLALCRGLDQALDGRMMPSRQPRPRVVPPAGQNH